MGVLKPLPLQGRGLERGQSIHSKLFKHPLREVGDLIYAYLFNISMKRNKGGGYF
jgi:hypothetical protein